MSNPEIEEIGRLLVQLVRDEAIQSCDRNLRPAAKGFVADRWRSLGPENSVDTVARTLIPDIVDDTLWQLMRALDEGTFPLSFTASNGKTVDLTKNGELMGWYAGQDWLAEYSRERFVDDYADLRSEPLQRRFPPPAPENRE